MWCLQPYHPSPAPFPPGRPGALWHPGNCSIPGMQLVGMWEPQELPRWLCVFLFHLHCLISLCLVYAEFIDLKCKIILGIVLSQAGANSLCLWLPIYSLLELIVSMEQLNKLKREWINVWVLVVKGSVLDALSLHPDVDALPDSCIPNYLDGYIRKCFVTA